MLVRVGLGLADLTRLNWLESWFKDKGLMLFNLSRENLFHTLTREPLDLLILSELFLGEDGQELIRNLSSGIDFPAILVLYEPGRKDSGAAFLAAGCEMAVPANISANVLREAIENLTQKRLEAQTSRSFSRFREPRIDDFASGHESVRPFIKVARKVVNSNSSLLILGETGVGKERLALAIHRESPRSRGPFIPINCAALPENLLESELFGHDQGAFTGAVRARRGAFELAHKGTIFLDEVGDMPLHLQAKLLRVLQDKEFQKIGGEKRIQVDVRVMAATNRDLMQEVQRDNFRKDLYYRLGVVSIMIPPLKSRPEDIPVLVRSFIDQLVPGSSMTRRNISSSAMEALIKYDWPGNVRELMNVLERALLLGDGKTIELEDLPNEITAALQSRNTAHAARHVDHIVEGFDLLNLNWKDSRAILLERFEKMYFEGLMRKYSGRIKDAASFAGITPRALHHKLTRHGICKEKFK